MKQTMLICVGVTACACGSAQDFDKIAPKTPPSKTPATAAPAAAPAEPAASEDIVVGPVKAIIVVPSEADVKKEGIPDARGIQVKGPDFLRVPEFERLLTPYLGQNLSEKGIRKLQREVILFCRKKDHPVIDVYYPEQDSTAGVIQMAVLQGKVGNINVIPPDGQRHFSDSLYTSAVRLQKEGYIRESKLLEDINWLNRNSYFREVEVAFRQGEIGHVDLDLRVVRERIPVRPYVGYENTGNTLLGEDRLLVGVNLGDVLGLDHQLDYQFTADVYIQRFKAHSLSYVVPLPWRHTLTLFGSYVKIRPELTEFPDITQDGTSYQASLRYAVPLPRVEQISHEVSAGFDYKRTDNNLEFGGTAIFDTPTEIGQVFLGYRAWRPDSFGSTALGVQGYYGPGGLFDHDNDQDYNATRPGADANYLYFRVIAERATKLPFGPDWRQEPVDNVFSWRAAVTYQWADSRLLPSEQLGVGGYATVRGYDERLVNGDDGWIINNELRTPAFRIGNLLGTPRSYDTIQFLAFSDYGAARTPEADFDLVSVGAGLRFTVSTHFQFRFDYGFRLTEKDLSIEPSVGAKSSRAHLAALLSF